jgi:ABC-2 type transport system permease protein
MNRAFGSLVTLQFKEFWREPDLIWWAFVIPIGLSWLLGIAIGSSGGITPSVGIIAEPGDIAEWRPWMERIEQGMKEEAAAVMPMSRFAKPRASREPIRFVPMTREEAVVAIKEGRISMFVERSGFGGMIYFFDPRNGEAETTYLMMERALSGALATPDEAKVVPFEVQGTRYIDFLVPGLLSMGIMSSALWGIGWALIEIRMKKLMRRMAATPLRKTLFLFSHFTTSSSRSTSSSRGTSG